jgi:hypothetical protein
MDYFSMTSYWIALLQKQISMRDTKFRNFSLARDPFGVGGLMCQFLKWRRFRSNYKYGPNSITWHKIYWSSEWITQITFFVM